MGVYLSQAAPRYDSMSAPCSRYRIRMGSRRTVPALAALIALALAPAACSSSSDEKQATGPPVVDGVSVPQEVTETSPGVYVLTFVVRFHDDDGDTVNSIRVQIPKGNFDSKATIPGAGPDSKAAQFDMTIQRAAKETYDI